MMDLGTFPGGTYSYAFAVNGGQIAGYSELSDFTYHAVLWQEVPRPVVTLTIASVVPTVDVNGPSVDFAVSSAAGTAACAADGAPFASGDVLALGAHTVVCAATDPTTGVTGKAKAKVMVVLSGQVGAKGDKGDPGEAGAQGPRGDTGATGAEGIQGLVGPQGPKGDKGDKGDPGTPGAAGAQGAQGAAGSAGPPGSTGAKGDAGAKGEKGDKGDPGTPGAKGDPGYMPRGALILVLRGDPAPAGYTYVGSFREELNATPGRERRENERAVVIQIYKKN